MPDSTIEIINGREGRRRWGVEEKLRIVAETHEPGATVGTVAARHDIYPSLLRTWRRHVRDGHLSSFHSIDQRMNCTLLPLWVLFISSGNSPSVGHPANVCLVGFGFAPVLGGVAFSMTKRQWSAPRQPKQSKFSADAAGFVR